MLIVLGAALVLASFVGVYFMRASRLSDLESQISSVDAELRNLRTVVNQVTALRSNMTELDRKLSVIGDLMKTRLYYPVFMDSLSSIIPAGVWITSLSSTGGSGGALRLNMSFEARDNFAVADLLNLLELSENYRNIVFSGISTLVGGETEELRVFTVSCRYIPSRKVEEGNKD